MKARHNPFRAECLEALPFRQPGFAWETFLDQLRTRMFRGAIVGPHGSGKTTFVQELIPKLQQSGERVRSLRLNEEDRGRTGRIVEHWLSASESSEILILDGAEQLGFFLWRRLLKKSELHQGLLITQHRPARLPTLLQCKSTFERFHELVGELVQQDHLPEESLLKDLYSKYRGNIRDCLRELYDRAASSTEAAR